MTHTMTFDTFQYAKDLKKAGFTEVQVEAQVKYAKKQTDSINDLVENRVATKQDIEALKNATKQDIEILGAEMKLLNAQMGYKIGGMIAASVAVLGFLIKMH